MGLLDYVPTESKKHSKRLSRVASQLIKEHNKKLFPHTVSKTKFKPPVYEVWINSDGWKQRRDRYLVENGHRCQACGNRHQLTVHHTHYGYLGREKDEHLAALCWGCHKEFHDKYGTKTTMQKQTFEFIRRKQMPDLTV